MIRKNKGLDERQQKIMDGSMALSGIVGLLYGIFMILYNLYRTKAIKSTYIEIGLVFIIFIFMISYYIVSGQRDSSISKDKRMIKLSRKLDERQKKRITVSLGMGGLIAFIYSFFIIAFTFLKTREFSSVHSQITLVVIMSIIIILYNMLSKEYDIPKTFLGKTLALGDTKEDKKFRCAHYIKDALRLAAFFLILDVLNSDMIVIPIPETGSKIFSYALNSFLRVIMFFTLNYLWGEFNVKKRRKFDESLEGDDYE